MKRITILLTKYSDWVSSIIYYVGGRGYTHVSLGLEEGRFYSFNYRGFCVETSEKHRRRGVRKSLAYEIEVPEEAYIRIQERIRGFENQKCCYHYTRLGLVCAVFQIPFSWRYHYICSQFVAEMLADTGAVPLAKANGLYLPNQLRPELERFRGLKDIVHDPI